MLRIRSESVLILKMYFSVTFEETILETSMVNMHLVFS